MDFEVNSTGKLAIDEGAWTVVIRSNRLRCVAFFFAYLVNLDVVNTNVTERSLSPAIALSRFFAWLVCDDSL